jgi:hypothetical protein
VALRDDELQGLIEGLSAELDRSVLVDDVSLRLIAYSPARITDDDVRKTSILMRETPQLIRELHFAHGIAVATDPVRTPPRPDIGLASRLCLPIRCDGTLFGYLWLIDAELAIDGRRCAIAQRCAAEIGRVMHRQHVRQAARRQRAAQLLKALLGTDAIVRDEAAREVLAKERLIAGTGVGVLAMRPRDDRERPTAADDRARFELAVNQFERSLPRRQAISCPRDDHAVMVVVLDAQRGLREIARGLQAALDAALARGPDATAIGYSARFGELCDAARGYQQARLALAVTERIPAHASPAGWEDVGAHGLVVQAAATPDAADLVPPGVRRLLECDSRASLVSTLEAYLDNGCDSKRTAEELSLHRASLYYRLQRVEEISGLSLKAGADRLALHAGLQLARLVHLV